MYLADAKRLTLAGAKKIMATATALGEQACEPHAADRAPEMMHGALACHLNVSDQKPAIESLRDRGSTRFHLYLQLSLRRRLRHTAGFKRVRSGMIAPAYVLSSI